MNDQEALIKEAKDPNIVGLNPKQAVAHLLCLLQDCADAMAKAQPAPVQESSTSYPMTLTCTRCGAVDKGTLTVPNVQRQWVGLTPDDIRLLEKENTVGGLHGDYCPTWDLIEAVEAKLREKNSL
jgi:hypothetical protein